MILPTLWCMLKPLSLLRDQELDKKWLLSRDIAPPANLELLFPEVNFKKGKIRSSWLLLWAEFQVSACLKNLKKSSKILDINEIKVIIEKSRTGKFLWNRYWYLGWIWGQLSIKKIKKIVVSALNKKLHKMKLNFFFL